MTSQDESRIKRMPLKMQVSVDVWRCDDLRAMIGETIRATVKDVELAKRLEHALGDEIAYNDGGGGGVGVA
jgi:hypothetical protein